MPSWQPGISFGLQKLKRWLPFVSLIKVYIVHGLEDTSSVQLKDAMILQDFTNVLFVFGSSLSGSLSV